MDYQREKGRINGLRTQRQQAQEFAAAMVPTLVQARSELPYRFKEGHSNQAIAVWLESNGYRGRYGGKWTSGTIGRLLDIHIGMIQVADEEYEIAFHAREHVLENHDYPNRDEVLSELGDIESKRAMQITEARMLAAALKGHRYDHRPVPPPAFTSTLFSRPKSHLERQLDRRQRRLEERTQRADEGERLLRQQKSLLAARLSKLAEPDVPFDPEAPEGSQIYRAFEIGELEAKLHRRELALRVRHNVLRDCEAQLKKREAELQIIAKEDRLDR